MLKMTKKLWDYPLPFDHFGSFANLSGGIKSRQCQASLLQLGQGRINYTIEEKDYV